MANNGPGARRADDFEHIAQSADEARNGYQQAVSDMRAMATDREEKGYETLTIPAGHTAPKNPHSGETDEWGLSYVIPGDKVEDFEFYYENGRYDETGVYQSSNAGHVFIVTEHIDMDEGYVIFIAGSYQMRHAPALVRTATERGAMYTHVKKLDGTHLGTFSHTDVSAFFPDPQSFLAYEQ